MMFAYINKDTLFVAAVSDEVLEWSGIVQEIPESLDPDCIKAELVDDVITLVEDPVKVAAKAEAAKQAQVTALHTALNAEVYAQMVVVYGTTNPDSATAFHETYKLAVASPEDFVTVLGMADAAAVTAYAQGKLDEIKAYAIWRLQKINEFVIAKNAVLNG